MEEGIRGRLNTVTQHPRCAAQTQLSQWGMAGGQLCVSGWERLFSLLGSLIAQVMEQVPCVYSAALLWAGEPGPGVMLGQGGWQSLFPKPERFSCNVCCCVVEARMSAALTCGCSFLRRELKLPAGGISWLVQILFSWHLALSSSHCSSLVLSSPPLFWVRSSPKPHLTGVGAGFSSREAGCTW